MEPELTPDDFVDLDLLPEPAYFGPEGGPYYTLNYPTEFAGHRFRVPDVQPDVVVEDGR